MLCIYHLQKSLCFGNELIMKYAVYVYYLCTEISESSYFQWTEPLLTSAAKIQGHQQKRQARH